MDPARRQTILVIGGGLGGLAFAQILGRSLVAENYRVLIFERDASPTHRGQGYLIGLHQHGLSQISAIPHVASVVGDMKQKDFAVNLVDGDANVMLQLKHGPGKDEIVGLPNRWKLRNALAEGVEVQWGKRFVRYDEFDTHVVAHFDDGSEATGEWLIGADGAKSRVRDQRCPALQLRHMPILNTAGSIGISSSVRDKIPGVLALAEKAYLSRALAADGNSVMWMEYEAPDGEARLLWAYSFPDSTPNPALLTDTVQLKQAMDLRAKVFGKELENLIRGTLADEYVLEATYYLKAMVPMKGNPLGKTSRVTLLGDAAHTMTTHRGLGANTAFADAGDLVRAFSHVEAPWQALADYEENMMKRGFEAINQSLQGSQMIHLVGMKSMIRNVLIRAIGWVLWAKHLVLG